MQSDIANGLIQQLIRFSFTDRTSRIQFLKVLSSLPLPHIAAFLSAKHPNHEIRIADSRKDGY